MRKILIFFTFCLVLIGFSGCGSIQKTSLFGGQTARKGGASAESGGVRSLPPRLGVNDFLWRASLETLNFMPLAEVDPFGGVIITRWYANPRVPNERFKADVYVLDTNLRADALKVSVFRQEKQADGWQDASVDGDTEYKIENAILTRARELYIASVRR